MKGVCVCVFLPPFLKFAQSFLLKLKALCLPLLKVVMMTSSVSVAMEACDAGSLEMIHGWNMLSGFLGKYCCCKVDLSSVLSRTQCAVEKRCLGKWCAYLRWFMNVCILVPLF